VFRTGDAKKIESPSTRLNRPKADLEGTQRGQSLVPHGAEGASEGIILRPDFGTFGKKSGSGALPSISADLHRAALTPQLFEKTHTQWWAGLDETKRAQVAGKLSDALAGDHFWIQRDDGSVTHIPAVLTPTAISTAELQQLHADTGVLYSAIKKAAQDVVNNPSPLSERLLGMFSDLERENLKVDPKAFLGMAQGRMDYLRDHTGAFKALELNSTLPCIQGFCQSLTKRWTETLRGENPALVQDVLPNAPADGLRRALVDHYRMQGGKKSQPSILVVSRRGDTELAELQYMAQRWSDSGNQSRHVFVDQVTLEPDGKLGADGQSYDILYRHIFARRLERETPLAQQLLRPGQTTILNPMTSPLELKALFAQLSEATTNPALASKLALTPQELDTISRVIPWTRLIKPGAMELPNHTRTDKPAEWMRAHRSELVLKKTWSYGGKAVLVGTETPEAEWNQAVDAAMKEPDSWIAQQFVQPERSDRLVLRRSADNQVSVEPVNMMADLGVYFTSVNGKVRTTGLLSRATHGAVVNIGQGGAVAPVAVVKP
jgi:glutathionylspermidine synthase